MNKSKILKLMLLTFLVSGYNGTTNVQTAPTVSADTNTLSGVIKVGVLIPYNGYLTPVAEGIADGVRAAAYAVNDSSDFNFDIELLIEDTAMDVDTSISAYEKFKGEGVELVIGAFASQVSTKIAELAKHDEIVQISYASIAGSLSNESFNYFYRTIPTFLLQAEAHVEVMKELELKKIVIVNIQDDYGDGFADRVKKLWEDLGDDYEILEQISYPLNAQNFESVVADVKTHNADGLSLITYDDDGAKLITELRNEGISVPFIGVDANAEASLVDVSETTPNIVKDVNLMLFTKPHSYFPGESGYDIFLSDRTACRFAGVCIDSNTNPVIFEDTAYDAMMVGALAIKAADNYTGSAINVEVRNAGKAYNGATGNKEFSSTTGDLINADYDIVQFQDGDLITVASWNSTYGLVKSNSWKNPTVAAPSFEAFYLISILAVISINSLKIRKKEK